MDSAPEPAPAKRRGRPPRGSRKALTRDRVLHTALAIVDAEGLDAITMRRVAKELDVDPMSLYNHVDGKDGILDGLAELLLAELAGTSSSGDPRADVEMRAREFRQAMLQHPKAAPVVLTRQLTSRAALAPIEAVLEPLLAQGFPTDQAVHAMRTALAFLLGTLLREVDAGPTFGVGDPVAGEQRRADLAASGLPAVATAAADLAVCDHEAEFEFGLHIMLDALERMRPRSGSDRDPESHSGRILLDEGIGDPSEHR
ncbi:TetR/AcrR family transcriptional regulator [Gordonia desulfuricans]|uniref:TetR/AcrR family transcriptional regulator n=1 Tax=Gordonia desulfuricans TaxID=89051 RepID=A0A7K3LM62_9ACTN|nr:TetR/AcrR family transcriptional regulator C-terminal domain-containing protein [Gordonia desulfuricans]NDK89334.1 TetR/AcrR family transcriptional regulator [Gordonia desulfuricans]